LRQGIHLRGYAQKQPKQEYKREAFQLFAQMLDMVRNEVTRILMTVRVQSPEEVSAAAQQVTQEGSQLSNVTYSAPDESGQAQTSADAGYLARPSAADVPRVGRNEPCPCGSGKKYKHCHGALA
jgi:preprotein translocase subunit SecA